MAVKYDVVATIGSYTSGGQTKYNTRKVGVILETSKGFALKLDCCFTPAGMKADDSGSVWLNLYPPKEHQRQQAAQIQQQIDQPPPQNQQAHTAYGGQPQHHPQYPQQGAPSQQSGGPDPFDDDIPFNQVDWRTV